VAEVLQEGKVSLVFFFFFFFFEEDFVIDNLPEEEVATYVRKLTPEYVIQALESHERSLLDAKEGKRAPKAVK